MFSKACSHTAGTAARSFQPFKFLSYHIYVFSTRWRWMMVMMAMVSTCELVLRHLFDLLKKDDDVDEHEHEQGKSEEESDDAWVRTRCGLRRVASTIAKAKGAAAEIAW